MRVGRILSGAVSVAMGVVLMLALAVALFWLLFTQVFGVDRLLAHGS